MAELEKFDPTLTVDSYKVGKSYIFIHNMDLSNGIPIFSNDPRLAKYDLGVSLAPRKTSGGLAPDEDKANGGLGLEGNKTYGALGIDAESKATQKGGLALEKTTAKDSVRAGKRGGLALDSDSIAEISKEIDDQFAKYDSIIRVYGHFERLVGRVVGIEKNDDKDFLCVLFGNKNIYRILTGYDDSNYNLIDNYLDNLGVKPEKKEAV
jgi:hypothetical protein